MKNLLLQLIQDIKIHKIRALLAIFGIAWGTIGIVLLMGFGAGFGKQIKKGFKGLGKGAVIVGGGKTTKPYKGFPRDREINLREEDVSLLKKRIPDIASISPEFISWEVSLRYGKRFVNSNVVGVYPSYSELRNLQPNEGRFINKLDIENRRRVIFLGNKIKEHLFGKGKAVGERILLNGIPFMVIGIMKEKTQLSYYMGRDEEIAFIPASTFSTMFGYTYLSHIIYAPKNSQLSSQIKEAVYKVLGRKHKFCSKDEKALEFIDLTLIESMITKITIGMGIFLAIIGTSTLVVAGAGVANVMYVIVDERVKEIGIRRAVGATRKDILRQFLLESLILSLTGGIIGLIVSFLILGLCTFIPEKGIIKYIGKPIIIPIIPVITVIVLLVISILAGYFPAKKASNLNPVECLRYE